jgi:hypothetical protein
MGSENAHGCAQNAENSFGFVDFFLERYHKDDEEFLNHIVRVRVMKWDSFLNTETKEQWMYTNSTNKLKSLNKRCLPARKLMATLFWDKKGVGS